MEALSMGHLAENAGSMLGYAANSVMPNRGAPCRRMNCGEIPLVIARLAELQKIDQAVN